MVPGWGPSHRLSHPHPYPSPWLGDAYPPACALLTSIIPGGPKHPPTSSPRVPAVSSVLTGGEIVAIIFGLLLGVALLLGMLVFRSRCFSCAPNSPPHPGSPVPRQKLLNAVPTVFPPPSPKTPVSPPTPCYFWGGLSQRAFGPLRWSWTPEDPGPHPDRRAQRRRHQRQQRQRDRVADGDRGEPGAPACTHLCEHACWEVLLGRDPGTQGPRLASAALGA